ncbi:MAG: hypothetical protein ACP5IJ_02815, partial [Candidatus Nanoarchaeia archaeon]
MAAKRKAKEIFDEKTWGFIKVVVGALAFWFAWNEGLGYNLAGAVALLSALAIISGLNYIRRS